MWGGFFLTISYSEARDVWVDICISEVGKGERTLEREGRGVKVR